MRENGLKENVVVLTGASSGIGCELAFQLAVQGAWLALAARNAEELDQVATHCREIGGRVIAVPTDVTDRQQVEAMVGAAAAEYGRIDTLINNAGISMWTYFEDVEELAIIEKIMQVNYMGSVNCTYYALPYLKASQGRLVAVSSLAGKTGVPTRSGYAASKHAMVGFFDSLRIELQKDRVSVTLIYPGFVPTQIRIRALTGSGEALGVEPVQTDKAMSAVECARLIVPAVANRKRELIMTARGKIGQYVKLLAPRLVDQVARRAIEKGR
ncbi:MAG TPA: SDR family oxidoreductase [Anaerolineales bacterium]|nr:SDR family oxidoreductase [Anaerolineales bacterium]